MKKQAGFTLIELIVVIVILGILAATALPRFVDLRGDAGRAAAAGVAGAVASASAINFSSTLANPGRAVVPAATAAAAYPVAVATICDVAYLGPLLNAGWPGAVGEYTAAPAPGSAATCAAAGGTVTCRISYTPSNPDETADAAVTCY